MCRVAKKDANYNIVDDFITTTRVSVLFFLQNKLQTFDL